MNPPFVRTYIHNCLTNALHFGDYDEMKKQSESMAEGKLVTEQKKATVFYVSRKPVGSEIVSG